MGHRRKLRMYAESSNFFKKLFMFTFCLGVCIFLSPMNSFADDLNKEVKTDAGVTFYHGGTSTSKEVPEHSVSSQKNNNNLGSNFPKTGENSNNILVMVGCLIILVLMSRLVKYQQK